MSDTNDFNNFLPNVYAGIAKFRSFATDAGIPLKDLGVLEQIAEVLIDVNEALHQYSPRKNYVAIFTSHCAGFVSHFEGIYQQIVEMGKSPRSITVTTLGIQHLESTLERLKFDLDFFKKLTFFNKNIVAIGANGSGKTTLATKLKGQMNNKGVVISAQRVLLIPEIDNLPNPLRATKELQESQATDKSNKDPKHLPSINTEFGKVLRALISENVRVDSEYRRAAIVANESGQGMPLPSKSSLDKTLEIWNSLLTHRKLVCEDGITISVLCNEKKYEAMKMSDGEKVTLYLIAQVLQCPEDGFVIVDEPEMYLHKSILKRLWDRLEMLRPDCIFVYLTHDLDFAASRIGAKKTWIKSYDVPSKWQIEDLPENEIPEELMMEIIGSRKPILFCEGERGSLDEKIYSLLLPGFTIKPIGTCSDVISYTRAFNKIPSALCKAFGLIDIDHSPNDRTIALKEKSVYCLGVSEVENLLLDENFLRILSERVMAPEGSVELIKKEVMSVLGSDKLSVTASYVSSKINYYFNSSHLASGKSMGEIKKSYADFTSRVDIDRLYGEVQSKIESLLEEQNYEAALKIYNNKGLVSVVQKFLKISDFHSKALRLLAESKEARAAIEKYLPCDLMTVVVGGTD